MVCEEEESEEEEPELLPGALLARVQSQSKRLPVGLEMKKVEVAADKRARLTKWDRYMKRFNYVKALDAALLVGV